MKNLILSAATAVAFVAVASTATAQETVTTVVTEPATAPIASPELQQQFTAVCNSQFVLSAKARIACLDNAMPRVITDGSAFRNTGIGTEFNTLIRQL